LLNGAAKILVAPKPADLRKMPALLIGVVSDPLMSRSDCTSKVAPARLLMAASLKRAAERARKVTLPALSRVRLSRTTAKAVNRLSRLSRVCPPPFIKAEPDQRKAPLRVRSPGPRRTPPLRAKAPSMTEADARPRVPPDRVRSSSQRRLCTTSCPAEWVTV